MIIVAVMEELGQKTQAADRRRNGEKDSERGGGRREEGIRIDRHTNRQAGRDRKDGETDGERVRQTHRQTDRDGETGKREKE